MLSHRPLQNPVPHDNKHVFFSYASVVCLGWPILAGLSQLGLRASSLLTYALWVFVFMRMIDYLDHVLLIVKKGAPESDASQCPVWKRCTFTCTLEN